MIPGLPIAVNAAISRLDAEQQSAFIHEYGRRSRDTFTAYLLSLLFLQYAYVGRIGITILIWVLSFLSAGVIGLIWFIVDLFRIPGIVARRNTEVAIEVLRDIKMLGGL